MEGKLGRRGFIASASGILSATAYSAFAGETSGKRRGGGASGYALDTKGTLRISVPGLKDEVRVCWASDTHLALHDSHDDAYSGHYARMAKWPGSTEGFSRMLDAAKTDKADLVALTGDTISFPTLSNVEFVARELGKCGVEWMYTAGNHDWHFEGDSGSDAEQRATWIERRLQPLYQKVSNPLMYSKVVKGVRFVAIDNSIYHITAEQLAFWRREVATGDPIVLLMHVPLWVEGFGICTCGNPSWGAASDPYWQIERREKWSARQSDEAFALREAVLDAPNLVAVFTGHIHRGLNACERGKFLFSIPQNNKGLFWNVRITGS